MSPRVLACLLTVVSALPAAKKNMVATAKGENQDLVLTVTLYIDPEGVKEKIGSDLDGQYILADVKVEPKEGKQVLIDRDDFTLRTDKDGSKTKPFAPSQIAGRGALVVRQTQPKGGGGPMIGGGYPGDYPGGYPGGYPPPVYTGGSGPPGPVGSGEIDASGGGPEVTVRNAAKDKVNPLEKVLKDKELPQKKVSEPAAGLLYFGMEKQKMKDLELIYGRGDNRISLRFK